MAAAEWFAMNKSEQHSLAFVIKKCSGGCWDKRPWLWSKMGSMMLGQKHSPDFGVEKGAGAAGR